MGCVTTNLESLGLEKNDINNLEEGIALMQSFGDNFKLDLEEINKDNYKQYLTFFNTIKNNKAFYETIKGDNIHAFIKEAIVNDESYKNLSIKGKSNYDKFKVYTNALQAFANYLIENSDQKGNSHLQDILDLNPYSTKLRDGVYLEENNEASIYAIRPFKTTIKESTHQGLTEFKTVYQALVYSICLKYGGYGDKNPKLKEILENTSKKDLDNILKEVLGDKNINELNKKYLSETITYLTNASFSLTNSLNKKNLKKPVKYLKSLDKNISEVEDNLFEEIYAIALNTLKDKLDESVYDTKKTSSIQKGLTFDTILANPSIIYVVDKDSKLSKDIDKYNSEKTDKITNVLQIDKNRPIENNLNKEFRVLGDNGEMVNIRANNDKLISYYSGEASSNTIKIGYNSKVVPTSVKSINESKKLPESINFDLSGKERHELKDYISTLLVLAEKNPTKEFRFSFEIKDFDKFLTKNLTGVDLVEIINEVFSERLEKGTEIPSNFKISKEIYNSGLLGYENYKLKIKEYVDILNKAEEDVVISDDLLKDTIDYDNLDTNDDEDVKNVVFASYLKDELAKLAGASDISITSNDVYKKLEYKESGKFQKETYNELIKLRKSYLEKLDKELRGFFDNKNKKLFNKQNDVDELYNEKEQPINIFYGSNENKILSNFAYRPFNTKFGEWEVRFENVEQAFQANKLYIACGKPELDQNGNPKNSSGDYIRFKKGVEILKKKDGASAKALGNKNNLSMTSEQVSEWDKIKHGVMKNLLRESFLQYDNALNALLATNKSKLTHLQGGKDWREEFPRLLMEVRSEFQQREKNFKSENEKLFGTANELIDLIPQQIYDIIPLCNTSVELFGEQNNIKIDSDYLKNHDCDYIKRFGVYFDKHRREDYQLMNYDYKTKFYIERDGRWCDRPINSNTRALLYIPRKELFKNNEEYENAIKQALDNAEKILRSGGRIITLKGSVLGKPMSEINRFEEANKIIWNELLKRGYNTMPRKKNQGIDVWTANLSKKKEDIEAFEERHKFLQKVLPELKQFTPSVKRTENNSTSTIEITVSNNMFRSGVDYLLKENGIIKFDSSDELYDDIKNAINSSMSSDNVILKFMFHNKIYFVSLDKEKFKDSVSITPNEVIIKIQEKIETQRVLESELDVDTSMFEKMELPTVQIDYKNPYVTYGTEKANIYINFLLNELTKVIHGDIIRANKDRLHEEREKVNKEITNLLNGEKNSESIQELSKLFKTKTKINLDLKDLDDLKISKFINTFECDGYTGLSGVIHAAFGNLINKRYGLQFININPNTLSDNNGNVYTQEEYDEIKEVYEQEVQWIYDNLSTYLKLDSLNIPEEEIVKKKEELMNKSREMYHKSEEAYQDMIGDDNKNIDMFVPFLLKRLGRIYNITINPTKSKILSDIIVVDKENDSEGSIEEENSYEEITETDEDNVSDGESKDKEAYQTKNEDPKKSLSAEIKELFLADVPMKGDDPFFNYCKINYFGEPMYEDPDNIFTILREKLMDCHTLTEMTDRLKDMIDNQGYTNLSKIYYRLMSWKSWKPNTVSKFYCAICTQYIKRESDVVKDYGSNFIVEDTKDTRFEYLKNQTLMNINTFQHLNDEHLSLIGKEINSNEYKETIANLREYYSVISSIKSKIKSFKKAKSEDIDYTKNYVNSDFVHSSNQEDIEFMDKYYNSVLTVLKSIGIPMNLDDLKKVLSNDKDVLNFTEQFEDKNKFKSFLLTGGTKEGLKGGNYLGFLGLMHFLSPALTHIPTSQMTYVNGKTYSNYAHPNYSSIMFDKLNDKSINKDTGIRKNKEYIENRFKKYPIFWKASNLNEIADFLEKYIEKNPDWEQPNWVQLILNVGHAKNNKEKNEIIKHFLSLRDEDFDSYKNDILQTYHRKLNEETEAEFIVGAYIENYTGNKKWYEELPNNCPIPKFDIWTSPYLKQIYIYGEPSFLFDTDKDKFRKIETKVFNKINGKEISDLTEEEYTQYCLDSFFSTYKLSRGQFGTFFSPVVSDAETARMELMPIANAIETLSNVTRAEHELSEALMKKFTNRLCSYYRYNTYITDYNRRKSEQEEKGIVFNERKKELKEFDGYSGFERDTDITEVDWEYKEDGTIPLDGLVFTDEYGGVELDLKNESNAKAIEERIDSLGACKYNYVQWDMSEGAPHLEEQVQAELRKQFEDWLMFLKEECPNITIPYTLKSGKTTNIKVFTSSKKTDSFELSEEEQARAFETYSKYFKNTNDDANLDNKEQDEFLKEGEIKEKNNTDKAEEEPNNTEPVSITDYLNKDVKDIESLLKTYFYAQAAATVQLHQFFNTSVGFYPNPVAHQKRGKEHNTPLERLNVERIKEIYGTEALNQKIIYLKDIEIDTDINEIIEIIDKSNNLSSIEKDVLKSSYSNLKKHNSMDITDGQAVRTMKSFKKIQEGLGDWSEEKEEAYNRLMDENEPVNFEDIRTLIFSPVKGFGFYMEEVEITKDYSVIKPVQLKDSEAILLWSIAKIRKKDNSVLQGLTEFMEDKDIDCAVFDSCVKVDGSGVIDLNSAKTAEDAKIILKNSIYKDSTYNEIDERVVHLLPWEQYGVATKTPEHFFENKAKFGNQLRRAMVGDLIPSKKYKYKDVFTGKVVEKTGKEIMNEFSNKIKESLGIDFEKLKSMFTDPDKLEDYLLKEINSNPSYPTNLTKSCVYNRKTRQFDMLGSPTKYGKIQQLMLALVRNRITSQKVAGGSLVQTSVMYDYKDLKIHFETLKDENGNIIYDENGEPKKYLEYAECYMPAYMKELYEDFIDENGNIDIEKMKNQLDKKTFDALTNMIGYRIPTEGLSSALKLRIKGFLSGYEGNSIVLPKEIVSLSGSDFDVDKMFIHRFSFKRNKYGKIVLITRKNASNDNEMKEAINNEIVQDMLQIMSIPENALLTVRPQGFANLKRSKMILGILEQPDNNYTISELRKMKDSELKKLYKDNSINFSYINPRTQSYFIRQNMIGKKLLGIWAVAKSAHYLFENSGLILKDKYKFNYNDTDFVKPDPITIKINGIDTYVSSELGSYLGAAADNAKTPVLFYLGITKDNINTACYLARLGLDSTSVGIMLKNKYFNKYKNIETNNYFKQKNVKFIDGLENEIMWSDDIFAECYDISNEDIITVKLKDGMSMKLTKGQICHYIAEFYANTIEPAAQQLNELTKSLRADSVNGAVSSNMAATYSDIQQKEAAEKKLNSEFSCFLQTSDKPFFTTNFDINKKETDFDTNSLFVQPFTNYGVLSVKQLFEGKLPHFGYAFKQAFEIGYITRNGYISKYNAKKLEQALYYYHFGQLPMFSNEEWVNEETGVVEEMSKSGKINYYKNRFPSYLNNLLAQRPDLLNNGFLKYIKIDGALNETEKENGKIRVVRMPDANLMDDTRISEINIGFMELIMSKDEKIRRLAWHLVRYSYYRQGFQYLPDGYGHFIPDEVYESIPGYKEMIASLIESDENAVNVAVNNYTFIEDFIMKNPSMAKSLHTFSAKEGMFTTSGVVTSKIKKDKFIKKIGYVPPYITYRKWNGNGFDLFLCRYSNDSGSYSIIGKVESDKYFVKYRYFDNIKSIHLLHNNYITSDIFDNIDKKRSRINTLIKNTQNDIDKNLKRGINNLTDNEKRTILRQRYGIEKLRELSSEDYITDQQLDDILGGIKNIDIHDETSFEMLLNFDIPDEKNNTLFGLKESETNRNPEIKIENC